MNDFGKTKAQLAAELAELRERYSRLAATVTEPEAGDLPPGTPPEGTAQAFAAARRLDGGDPRATVPDPGLLLQWLGGAAYEHRLREGRLSWASSCGEVLGYECGEGPGSACEWASHVHPEDRDAAQAALQQAASSGQPYELEYRFRHAQGHYLWVHDVGRVSIPPEGPGPVAIGVMQDVDRSRRVTDALRRREWRLSRTHQLLRAVLDSLPVRLFWKDDNLAYLGCNLPFARDAGLERPEDVEGRTDAELHWAGAGPLGSPDDRHVLETRQPELDCEEQWTASDGREIWIGGSKVPFYGPGGKLLGLLGIYDDITRRRQAVGELQLSHAQLKASMLDMETRNRELQEFAYVASHDLQEPLRKVRAFGNRVQTRYGHLLDETGRDYLRRMEGAAARMQRLINDLLILSRVTTQGQPFSRVDLGQILHDVVSDLETRLDRCGGTVEVGELPVVDADPVQMRQLFMNLIGNALKFHRPEVPPQVRIRARVPDAAGAQNGPAARGECLLCVEDNGIGLDAKYAERIFAPFQRLHGSSEYEGTGMGLAICRRIVERHGGAIAVESAVGQGSSFIVRLPLRQDSR
ncbi:MAG: ATP-binding protein [Candidatus Latescibacterota bacterium]